MIWRKPPKPPTYDSVNHEWHDLWPEHPVLAAVWDEQWVYGVITMDANVPEVDHVPWGYEIQDILWIADIQPPGDQL